MVEGYFCSLILETLKTNDMNKVLWILSFVIFGCGSTGENEKPVDASENQIPGGAIVQDYPGEGGLQKVTLLEGDKILGEGDFLHGLHHGTWTTYDEKAKVTSITTYLNGKKQGTELIFDDIGYVETKAYYHNDQLFGEYLRYRRRNVVEKKTYINGVLQGMQYRYYPDGKTLMEESNYTNGVIDGVAKYYNQEGELSFQYTYDMGELVKDSLQ